MYRLLAEWMTHPRFPQLLDHAPCEGVAQASLVSTWEETTVVIASPLYVRVRVFPSPRTAKNLGRMRQDGRTSSPASSAADAELRPVDPIRDGSRLGRRRVRVTPRPIRIQAALPVYTPVMAKVMISLPDELLDRLDDHARRRGTTRSGLLRELVERELRADVGTRRRRIRRLLSAAAPHGGDAARHVREQRRAR
jgi:hypothetical protein